MRMVRTRGTAGLLALLMLGVGVAGCSGSDAGDAAGLPTGPVDPAGDVGTIRGLVQDDELNPLANATVAVAELADTKTTTGPDGEFVLEQVPPGTYRLFVQKLGFESAAKSVSVSAGDETRLDITLDPLPVEEPHHETFQQAGKVDWGVRVETPVSSRGYAGGDQSWDYDTSDRTDAMDSMIIEDEWQGTQALAAGMRLRVEVDGESNNLDFTFCVLEGPSPLVCYVGTDQEADNITKIIDNDHSDCPGDDTCHIQWRGFTATGNTGQAVDLGAMLDQEFTVYTTHFYRQHMPPGFSARPDA